MYINTYLYFDNLAIVVDTDRGTKRKILCAFLPFCILSSVFPTLNLVFRRVVHLAQYLDTIGIIGTMGTINRIGTIGTIGIIGTMGTMGTIGTIMFCVLGVQIGFGGNE